MLPAHVDVLLALGGAAYEEPLLRAIERGPSRVRVARRCLDLADLLSAVAGGVAQAAVVSGALTRLDAEAVARMSAAGMLVVGTVDPTDPGSAQRLRALGIAMVLTVDEPTDGPAALAGLTALLYGAPGAVQPTVELSVEPPPLPRGRLIAVWGPAGAPGRTTVAATIADEMARLQTETLLADADTYGPSVAQVLGVLDEASGLAAAVREANAGLLDGQALTRCARTVRPDLRVLTGVTRADRWPELPGAALAVVWRTARVFFARTVVDCGFCLEQDEEISFDTSAPRRNVATLVTLASADVVLAVGSADPVGLGRLIRSLPELAERAPTAEVRVVVNQVRKGVVGRNPERRLAEVLKRHAGVGRATFVPLDREAVDSALSSGRSLGEVAAGSPARSSLAVLAAELRAG